MRSIFATPCIKRFVEANAALKCILRISLISYELIPNRERCYIRLYQAMKSLVARNVEKLKTPAPKPSGKI